MILHEFIGQRKRGRSVGDNADLEIADLVAIKAGGLLARGWCGGESRRTWTTRRKHCCGRRSGRTRHQAAARKFGHDYPPLEEPIGQRVSVSDEPRRA